MTHLRRSLIAVTVVVLTALAPATSDMQHMPTGEPIRIGAVFPLSGSAAQLAGFELRGVQIAADLVNADGGVAGRPIQLDVRDLERGADAPAVMASLRNSGVQLVIGAYSSDLSIAASQAASAAGLVYWEAGAVADRLTGRGLPTVFRVGASGTNLGSNSSRFAAAELAPRLGAPAGRAARRDRGRRRRVRDIGCRCRSGDRLLAWHADRAAGDLQPGDPGLAAGDGRPGGSPPRRHHPRLAHPGRDRVSPRDARLTA